MRFIPSKYPTSWWKKASEGHHKAYPNNKWSKHVVEQIMMQMSDLSNNTLDASKMSKWSLENKIWMLNFRNILQYLYNKLTENFS